MSRYLVSSGETQDQAQKAVRDGVLKNAKNKSKEAREAKELSAKFVSEVDVGDHTGGQLQGKKSPGIKNLPGASKESHWVDVTVLSVSECRMDPWLNVHFFQVRSGLTSNCSTGACTGCRHLQEIHAPFLPRRVSTRRR